MQFTEDCIRDAAMVALGKTTIEYQGREINFTDPFERLTIVDAIKKYAPQYTDA